MQYQPDVAAACLAFADAQKPAGYICIAPTIIPMIYGEAAQGTIGNDHGTAAAFNQLGGQHVDCPVEGIVFDERHKVLSTPPTCWQRIFPKPLLV